MKFCGIQFFTLVVSVAANSNLILYGIDGNPAIEAIGMQPANGPSLPTQGIVGRLFFLRSDRTGCSGMITTMNTVMETASLASSGIRPIVLIERSSHENNEYFEDLPICTFEDKIKNVQLAGASAVVIYDNIHEEDSVIMKFEKPDEILIPSTFISYEAGMELLSILNAGIEPIAILRPDSNDDWRANLFQFEVLTFSSGYLLFFTLWLPVAIWKCSDLIKKRKFYKAIFDIVINNETLKTMVESQMNPIYLPLDSIHHPSESFCNYLSKFLKITFFIYLFESLLFFYDSSSSSSSTMKDVTMTYDDQESQFVYYGVNHMMNALFIASLVCMFEIIFDFFYNSNWSSSSFSSSSSLSPSSSASSSSSSLSTSLSNINKNDKIESGSYLVIERGNFKNKEEIYNELTTSSNESTKLTVCEDPSTPLTTLLPPSSSNTLKPTSPLVTYFFKNNNKDDDGKSYSL